MSIPDQSANSKVQLVIPQSKVEEKIITDYTAQAKAAEKTYLDGKYLDKNTVFETLKKLKSKEKRKKKGKKVAPKRKKKPLPFSMIHRFKVTFFFFRLYSFRT